MVVFSLLAGIVKLTALLITVSGSSNQFCGRKYADGRWISVGNCDNRTPVKVGTTLKKLAERERDCRQAMFEFAETDHLNYVQYNDTLPRLESFTACVWIQPATAGQAVKGGVLSYCAVGSISCNALTVSVLHNQLQLFVVSGKGYDTFRVSIPQITEETHLCIVLSNISAHLRVYLNGAEPVQPFSTTAVIPSGGILIIGQDQDNEIVGSIPGTPNQAADGFYGKIRGFLLWDRDVGGSEIVDMYRSGCSCTNGAIVRFDSSTSRIKGKISASWDHTCDAA